MYFKRDTALPTFFPLPQFLLARTLSANAKLLYALLLARTQLSQRNGWVDENGSVYVIYTVRQMALALRCSVRTVSTTLGELEREGLLRRKRLGITKANHLFLLLPDDVQTPAAPDGERLLRLAELDRETPAAPDGERLLRLAEFDRETPAAPDGERLLRLADFDRETPAAPDGERLLRLADFDREPPAAPDGERLLRLAELEGETRAAPDGERLLRLAELEGQPSSTHDAQSFAAQDRQKSAAPDGKASAAPDGQPAAAPEGQELPTSKIERDNRPIHKRRELQARLAYGTHGNVFLAKDELALLRTRFPRQYIAFVDDFSERIARTGDIYPNHCETLLRMLELERDE